MEKYLEKVNDVFENIGYNFNHIEEVNGLTISNIMDMSYDFYIKHNMQEIEWKMNAMINKNKSLIINSDCNWRHPLERKFESYRL